jgi:hypothetical protein
LDLKSNLPNIYYFNPTCEYAVANGNAWWQPNKLLQKMENDLSALPLWFAKPTDFILTHKMPSHEFINSLKRLNIAPPDFIEKSTFSTNTRLLNTPINQLFPWGWSPAAHQFLSPLKNSCSTEFKKSAAFNWQPKYREFYSRKFARTVLDQLISDYPNTLFISKRYLPEIATTKEEFETVLNKWGKIIAKAPWSSSGRGLQPVTKTPVHPKVWEKLMGIVNEQGYAIVEPYLNKVFDLAFQFQLEKGKVTYLGTSYFTTDKKGQYTGNSLNGLPSGIEKDVAEFVQLIPKKIINPLIELIERTELAKNYEGFLGVDTLIFRDKNGELKINPCLEINVKQTMGLLSLQLEKLIQNNKKGIFRTFYKPGVNFQQFAKTMEEKYPITISNYKIVSGFFPLTDASNTTLFGAYILV